MQQDLAKELQGIGLSEKEAKVYLAGLELGPATAQQIAAKATVNRPSAYIAIESLIKRGLMSSFQKGKKRYFNAGSAKQLLYGIEQEKHALYEKEVQATKIIDGLKSFLQASSEASPIVSVFEGYDSFRAIQEDILKSKSGVEILELTSLEHFRKIVPQLEKIVEDIRRAILKKHKIRTLYSVNQDRLEEPMQHANVVERYLDANDYPIACEFLLYDDKVAIPTYGENSKIIVIQNQAIATTTRILFEALWDKGKKYE